MRKAIVFLTGIVMMTFISSSFAQEEGLVQKLKRRFSKKPETVIAPAANEAKKSAAPVLPGAQSTAPKTVIAPKADIGDPAAVKKQILKDIKDTLDSEQEVVSVIPNLKSVKDDAGIVAYTYQGVKLEDLELDALKKLSERIVGESNKNRDQRIQEQMEQVRAIRNIQSQISQTQQMQTINSRPVLPVLPARPPETPSVVRAPQAVSRPSTPAVPTRR